MRVGRIGHAGVVVSNGKTRCFMDPVLFPPQDGIADRFDPPFEVDVAAARAQANLIVISHHHGDHFCPRSLNVFRRSCPVVYPLGSKIIERTLERLGFQLRVPLAPGGRIEVEGLEMTATASRVPFPEIGAFFRAGGRGFWNTVDTELDESIIAAACGREPPPDLLFATYQPLIEAELQEDALGASFPFTQYGDLLRHVLGIRPHCVVPGSFGFRYVQDWQNQRGMPMSAAQFADDLRHLDPRLEVLELAPGDGVALGEKISFEAGALDFVRAGKAGPAIDFRPDRGVPPLADRNLFGASQAELRGRVARLLDGSLLPALARSERFWLERMARLRVLWRLEVMYPAGEPEVRVLDFTRTPLAWGREDGRFVKLQTSVTASALVALEDARLGSYAFIFSGLRMVNRLYEAHACGVSFAGNRDDEPITRVLLDGADDRYVDRLVDELLAQSPPQPPS